jgi:potassium-transporting ATPase KdpC subunit
MWRNIVPAFRLTVVMTVLTGFLYPGLVTALCRALFPRQAVGSLVVLEGRLAGSELIGQNFTRPEYFHPRPSAAGSGYDPLASGGSNLGPANPKLQERVRDSVSKFRADDGYVGPVPADLATASGSGLDPHISPAAALAQVARVARARAVAEDDIQRAVAGHVEARTFGFLGEPRVNVLMLNLELDRRFPANSSRFGRKQGAE